MRAVRSLFALTALIATLASAAAHAGALADLEVYDRTSGRTLPIYEHEGRLYVAGEPRHQYELRIRNSSAGRLLAVTSVDGVNVISGETAAQQQSGYVLGAWDSVRVEGWRKNLDEVATFYFTRLADSYAARTGRPHDVGVIGVALFREHRPHYQPCCTTLARRSRRCAFGRTAKRAPRRPTMPSCERDSSRRARSGAARRSSAQVTAIAKTRPRSTWTSSAPRRRRTKRS